MSACTSAWMSFCFLSALAVIAASVSAAPLPGDVINDPPVLQLEASQVDAKTGDVVSVTIRSYWVRHTWREACTPGANNTTACRTVEEVAVVNSPGPVTVRAFRANGVELGLVTGPLNLADGVGGFSFRVTDSFGFDTLRIEVRDESTGAIATPLRVHLTFSEEQRYLMWRDALRRMQEENNAVISAGESARWSFVAALAVAVVLLDISVLLSAAHSMARLRGILSWVDWVKIRARLRFNPDPTAYAMDLQHTSAPNIPAEARRLQIRYKRAMLRTAAFRLLDVWREYKQLGVEDEKLDQVIRATREKFGLPADIERRGSLTSRLVKK